MQTDSPPPEHQTAQFRFGIIGFYLSCAGVAFGAAIGAAGFLWFESTTALVIGSLLTITSTITCFRSLATARS